MNNDYLKHYGMLGMKWGRRKTSVTGGSKSSSSIKEKKQRVSEKFKKVMNTPLARATRGILISIAAQRVSRFLVKHGDTILDVARTGVARSTVKVLRKLVKHDVYFSYEDWLRNA